MQQGMSLYLERSSPLFLSVETLNLLHLTDNRLPDHILSAHINPQTERQAQYLLFSNLLRQISAANVKFSH